MLCGHNSVVSFASKCRLLGGDPDGTDLGDTLNFIRKFEGTNALHTIFANLDTSDGSAKSRLGLTNTIK